MSDPRLQRRLGTSAAVFIGLGSMMGAGVFAVFQPAAQVAGAGLLVGLVIAAVVACCNAMSSAQLAAQLPSAGGTYLYGRELIGPWWGFAAGWSFVVGKTASAAAMAVAFAAYAAPAEWSRPVAALAVAVVVVTNCLGVTRTATATRVIVVAVLLVLAVVVGSGVVGPEAGSTGVASLGFDASPLAVLQSAGLLFFAFAGYARIATLGEEVRDPAKTIPRAIGVAFAVAVVVYAAVAVVSLLTLGADGLASSARPLAAVVETNGWPWAATLVRLGAAAACLGALLAVFAGIGRTAFAMARTGDLPRALDAVHPRFATPYRAELLVGAVVIVLVLLVDLRSAIGFSSFGVLLYYVVANVAAYRQTREHRRYPRAVSVFGAVGCVVLMFTLPPTSVLVGSVVVLVGFAGRAVALRQAQ
ncbi:APC family permease [Plantibacter cousiniae (nom. nud.)]|uniref:Amino acid/polyamine/organocation transporter, APC superfamily n=1 Tax=Plantibacter cousiniae (nom. nud.) TaxID=199709 RepID=A0ABY1LNJ0_9MICO|nr:APC family permease [Plantibacter cousiniae]SKC66276.1 amino acid/polyamine/organocation transporter, APC superfamily [Plantibacter cousiniae]